MEIQSDFLNIKSDKLVSNQWNYLAEGNLHIILRYIGDETEFQGKVLKVEKINDHAQKNSQTTLECLNQKLSNQFPNELVPYLLKEKQLKSMQHKKQTRQYYFLVEDFEVQQKFLESVASNIQTLRPSYRAQKHIDINKPMYIAEDLFIDFSQKINEGGSSFNIEIKPKSPLPIQDSTDPSYSKFFKVQLQKLQNQLGISIDEISVEVIKERIPKYDPKKLFEFISQESVQDLFENPSNNLKVFLKGKEVKDLKEFVQNQPFNIYNVISKSLQENDILRKILDVQNLPKKMIDETIEIYEKLIQTPVSSEDIEKALKKLEDPQSIQNEMISSIAYLANFMQLITWSDISIIINYIIQNKEEIDDPRLVNFDKIKIDDYYIYFRMRIIDYQLKNFTKLYAYKNQAIEIQDIFQKYMRMKNAQQQIQ